MCIKHPVQDFAGENPISRWGQWLYLEFYNVTDCSDSRKVESNDEGLTITQKYQAAQIEQGVLKDLKHSQRQENDGAYVGRPALRSIFRRKFPLISRLAGQKR